MEQLLCVLQNSSYNCGLGACSIVISEIVYLLISAYMLQNCANISHSTAAAVLSLEIQ